MAARRAPTFYAALQQGDRLGQLTLAQHGEAFTRRNKCSVEHGDALLTPDAIRLADTSQQRIGLATVVEDVRTPCRGPTDVERMP